MKRLLSLFSIVLISFLLVSCDTKNAKYKRIETVASEVDYGYIAINNYVITKNFKQINLEDEANKLVRNKEEHNYPYSITHTDEHIYYLYHYDRDGKIIYDSERRSYNRYTFDVGLFKYNFYTEECTLVYDFKEIYPTYRYSYTRPGVYSNLKNDKYLLFHYNGKIEIFNLESNKIIYTKQLFQKDLYIDSESFPYRINEYGDHYAIIDGKLEYYEYKEDKYIYHEFNVLDNSYLSRYGDIIILSKNANIVNAYDLKNDSEVSIEEASLIKKEYDSKIVDNNPFEFIFDDKTYYYHSYMDEEIVIQDSNKEDLVTINVNFMKEKSEAYRKLSTLWLKNTDIFPVPIYIKIINNKILIFFQGYYSWASTTPLFIYEYDIYINEIKYVGYQSHYGGIDRLIILE